MLLQDENWHLGYHQIISDCLTSNTPLATGGTVLILANPDADALCAARILSYALRADKVPYQLRPCGGYKRLIQILDKLNLNAQDDDDDEEGGGNGVGVTTIRAVVLLNLGATRNLQKALFDPIVTTSENGEEETTSPPLLNTNLTKIYVLDSHRPYHLANIHAETNIVLWNDFEHWHNDEGGVPSDGDGLSGESDDESSEEEEEDDDDDDSEADDGDSEDEAEFEEDDNVVKKKKKNDDDSVDGSVDEDEDGKRSAETSDADSSRKRARKDPAPETPDIEDSDNDNANDNDSIQSKKETDEQTTLTKQPKSMTLGEIHTDRRNRIRNYYGSGSFHSSPVAFMVYKLLAEQLRHDSVGDLLWLACIGVTDAFIHNRLDLSGYAQLAMDLQGKIEKVYPDLSNDDMLNERMANTMHAEELYENDNYNGPRTQVGFSENGKILYQRDEFRFFLLRHTSLWDAMVLSPDLNTKMELWRSSGIKKLREMLAKMGLPLTQCQQPYAFMQPSLKRRLKTMMKDHEEVSDVCCTANGRSWLGVISHLQLL